MKALLLTAAASAAGIIAAQAQVYSVNVVGFVNLDMEFGFNHIANPLKGTNNLLSTIMPNPPDNTSLQVWDEGLQQLSQTYTYLGGGLWDPDGNLDIAPGVGLLVSVPAATRITFVGEVPQGLLTNQIPANFSLKSSIVPQAGLLETDLGFVPRDNDSVSLWDAVNQSYENVYTYLGGGLWDPQQPSLDVGESFFVSRDPLMVSPAADWVRNFQVQ